MCVLRGGGGGGGGGKGGGNSNGFKWLSLCITSVVQSIGNLANCGVGDVFLRNGFNLMTYVVCMQTDH